MNMHSPQPADSAEPRGWLEPTHERAVLALKAINESRWRDASRHVESLDATEPRPRAWRCYLQGDLFFRRGDLDRGETSLLLAASTALALSVTEGLETSGEALRLAAGALDRVGAIRRRLEQFAAAERAHLLAYRIRLEHGSLEEQWESALGLSMTAEFAGKKEDAIRWAKRAIQRAEQAADPSLGKQAAGWDQLARALAADARFEEAATAARRALELWRTHDPSVAAVPQAQMRLGQTLLKMVEGMFESPQPEAAPVLREAIAHLRAARDPLLAFGANFQQDGARCDQLIDLAQRLLESLD